MFLTTQFPALTYAEYGLSPPEFMELREMTRSFADIGAFMTGEANLTAGNRPRRVRSASVTRAFFLFSDFSRRWDASSPPEKLTLPQLLPVCHRQSQFCHTRVRTQGT